MAHKAGEKTRGTELVCGFRRLGEGTTPLYLIIFVLAPDAGEQEGSRKRYADMFVVLIKGYDAGDKGFNAGRIYCFPVLRHSFINVTGILTAGGQFFYQILQLIRPVHDRCYL